MPYKISPNPQLTTFETAKAVLSQLGALGVPVGTLYEVTVTDRYDTTDQRYFDDGSPHQYVAKLWNGPEQEIGLVKAALGAGGYNAFLRLAENAGLNVEQAESAVINLPLVWAAADAVLKVG